MRCRTERTAFAVAAALFLQVAENSLPHPVPFVRIGVSNSVTMFAARFLSPAEFACVVFYRLLFQLLLSGLMFSPMALMTVAGGLSSAAVAFFFRKTEKMSFVGVSALSALAANAAQCAVSRLMFPSRVAWGLFAVMAGVGIPASVFTGWLAEFLFPAFRIGMDRGYGAACGLEGMRFRPRLSLIAKCAGMLALIVVFNLLSPHGEVLCSIGVLRVTRDALAIGLRKAAVAACGIALGWAVRVIRVVRLPFFGKVMSYYGQFGDEFFRTGGKERFLERIFRSFSLDGFASGARLDSPCGGEMRK